MYISPAPMYSKKRRYRRYKKNTTKSIVKKEIQKAKWSRQQICSYDLAGETISNSGYLLTTEIVDEMLANNKYIFLNGTQVRTTDGGLTLQCKIKIDYIRWQLRYALGETETVDAVSQNVRELLFRVDDQYEEVKTNGVSFICDDHDGSIKYPSVYGGKLGLYSDRFHYVISQATDGDTTAGGQVMSRGTKNIKYVDTFTVPSDGDIDDVKSEKGQLVLTIQSDDPSGTNGKVYGYVEIGWRYLEN